jgi:hypothetical protein
MALYAEHISGFELNPFTTRKLMVRFFKYIFMLIAISCKNVKSKRKKELVRLTGKVFKADYSQSKGCGFKTSHILSVRGCKNGLRGG